MWEFPWPHFLPPGHPKGCGFAAPESESDARNSVSSQEGLGDSQSLDSDHQNCRVDLGSAVEMEAQLYTSRGWGSPTWICESGLSSFSLCPWDKARS